MEVELYFFLKLNSYNGHGSLQMTFGRRNTYFSLVLLLYCCSACAPNKYRSHSQTKHDSGNILTVSDSALTRATLELLAREGSPDSEDYKTLRQAFDHALATYLARSGRQLPTELRVRHDGMTFVFPLQIIRSGSDRHPVTPQPAQAWRTVTNTLRGDLLDLVPYPDGSKKPGKFLALFADSLVVITWSGSKVRTKSHWFHPVQFRNVKPSFPTGMINLSNHGGRKTVELVSSSLRQGIAFEVRGKNLQALMETPGPATNTAPANWNLNEETGAYTDPGIAPGQFLSYLRLPRKRYLTLDESGFINVYQSDSSEPIWRSQRAWGDRLFAVQKQTVVVCDSRQTSFVAFATEGRGLRLLGQSPRFPGTVSAVTRARDGRKDGYLVATKIPTGPFQTAQHLLFITNDNIGWQLPVTVAPPQFPDFGASLSVLVDAPLPEIQDHAWRRLPRIVFRSLYETPYELDDRQKLKPVLVAEASPDEHFRIWDIELRSDVNFADGTALTGKTLLSSWRTNWLQCARARCPLRPLWSNILGAEEFIAGARDSISGIQTIGSRQLRIFLKQPRPDFLRELTVRCFAPSKTAGNKIYPIGTGAFLAEELVQDGRLTRLVCRRNSYYRHGQPPLQEIRFSFRGEETLDYLAEATSAATQIKRKHQLDFLKKTGTHVVRKLAQETTYFAALNPGGPGLATADRRNAIITETNQRNLIANIMTEAEAEPAGSFFGIESTILPAGEAGQSGRTSTLLLVSCKQQDPVAVQIAERMVARLNQTGRPARLQKMTGTAFGTLLRSGRYHIAIDAFNSTFGVSPLSLLALNWQGYVFYPDLTRRLEESQQSPGKGSAAEMERTLISEGLLAPIVRIREYAVLPPALRNFDPAGVGQLNLARAWRPAKYGNFEKK